MGLWPCRYCCPINPCSAPCSVPVRSLLRIRSIQEKSQKRPRYRSYPIIFKLARETPRSFVGLVPVGRIYGVEAGGALGRSGPDSAELRTATTPSGDLEETQIADGTAKLIFYTAFIDGKLKAPRTLQPEVHRVYLEPQYSEFSARTMWSLSNAFTSAFNKLDPIPQFKPTAKLCEFQQAQFSHTFLVTSGVPAGRELGTTFGTGLHESNRLDLDESNDCWQDVKESLHHHDLPSHNIVRDQELRTGGT